MRALFQIAFLTLYVASSYNVTQERVAKAATEVHHSASAKAPLVFQVGSNSGSFNYPKFREAKPRQEDVVCASSPVEQAQPGAVVRHFSAAVYFPESGVVRNAVRPRAPPASS